MAAPFQLHARADLLVSVIWQLTSPMALKHVQKTYEKLGAEDPLYAVISFKEMQGNRWDPEAFFARGKVEIQVALEHLEQLDVQPVRGRALDFGCGVGRLSQALAEAFSEVVGIDISSTMIENAERFNRHGSRCRYRVNTAGDLASIESASFDFVYSNITLQHIPPQASTRYLSEFMRVLKPGGVALFQLPDGPRHREGSLSERWYNFRRGPLRRFWKRIRGKAPVEVHYVNRDLVAEIIATAGGRVIDVKIDETARPGRHSLFHTAVKN